MKTVLNPFYLNRLKTRIESVKPDSTRLWGKMTAHQMLVHVSDQVRLSEGEIPTRFRGNFFSKKLLKKLVLLGMPTPKGKVETVYELKQDAGGTKRTHFETDRQELLELLVRFESRFEHGQKRLHPAFGEMNKKEWARLVYIHTDYHLRQFNC